MAESVKTGKYTANVIGATGLVGKQLVSLLLQNDRFEKVKVFVRRPTAIQDAKLEEYIVNFNEEKEWEDRLTGDVLFSALGTTLKDAGSKARQYDVDFSFNYHFAARAKENGISTFVLVSSVGANRKSPFFYPRMKGELETAVEKLGFQKLTILRPGPLHGTRENRRLAEELSYPVMRIVTKFGFKKYAPIDDVQVASAMIYSVIGEGVDRVVYEGEELFQLSESLQSTKGHNERLK